MVASAALRNKISIKQILSCTTIILCLITLIMPWIYIGMRTTSGRKVDFTEIVDLDEMLDDIRESDIDDILEYDTDGVRDSGAIKELRAVKKAAVKFVNAVRDSKLSPTETAMTCIYFAKLFGLYSKYSNADIPNNSVGLLWLAGVAVWLLILTVACLSIYGIWAELSGKKGTLAKMTIVYLILVLLYVVLTVYVNHFVKDSVGDSFGVGFFFDLYKIEDPSLLHIQFAPILGSILLIGNLIVDKMNLFGAATSEINVGIESVGKKVIWKCDCGSVNPSSSRFCAKCGKARPVDNTPLDFKTDVIGKVSWTCTCGNINPKKNTFCTKCDAMQPSETVTAAYCKMCGRPVASGTELCKECLLKMGDTSRIRRAAPSERHTEETIADKKAGTPTDVSRVKKGFRPPTSLD